VIDTHDLPPEESDRLTKLITAASFFELPPIVGPPRPGAADYRKQTLTVTEAQRSHAVEVFEPIADRALANLIDYMKRRRIVSC